MITSNNRTKEEFKRIGNMLSHFLGIWAISIGRQTEIFSLLAKEKKPMTINAISRTTRLDSHFVRSWVITAHSFDLVTLKNKKSVSISSHIEKILVDPNSKYYLGDTLDLCMETLKTFSHLSKNNRQKRKSYFSPSMKISYLMARITKKDFPNILNTVINKIPSLKKNLTLGGAILDIGVGLAQGPIFFSKHFPQTKIEGIDFDKKVIAQAKKYILKSGLSKNITLKAQDAKKMSLKNNCYDLIYLNLSLHEICSSKKEMNLLVKKCRSLLKKGGYLLICEHPYYENLNKQKKPVNQILLGLQLQEAFFGLKISTIKEYKTVIRQAGFKKSTKISQPNPSRVFLLAKKS